MPVIIKNKLNNQVYEYQSLDKALRDLVGIEPKGYKFNQKLLTKPGLKTYRNAIGLLRNNGYELVQRAKNVKTRKVKRMNKAELLKFMNMMLEALNQVILNHGRGSHKGQAAQQEYSNLSSAMQRISNGEKYEFDYNKWKKNLQDESFKRDLPKEVFEQYQKVVEEVEVKVKEVEVNGVVQEVEVEESEEKEEVVEEKKEEHEGEHFQFRLLLNTIKAKVNVLLVGPAGSGKTTAAEHVAAHLNLKYYSISVGMQTTKTEFFGYMDAQGRYVKTLFREAYENGGLFLIDEMDAGNANVLTAMNQALSNNVCAFPDGMVTKHVDFVIIASANTYGTGANREYVGRNQLDAATLDRFAVINWDYDEKIEKKNVINKKWLNFVLKCRNNANKYKIRTVVSPRASFHGDKMLANGSSFEECINLLIKKGLNETEYVKLVEGAMV